MFNAEQKAYFIHEKVTNPRHIAPCIHVFEKISPYEEAWNADYATVAYDKLVTAIESMVGLRSRGSMASIGILRAYVQWGIANGLPGFRPDILLIDTFGLTRMRIMTVRDPAHLQKCLDQMFESEDKQMVDNVYRCCYWLVYSGVPERYILAVKCNNVNLEQMTVTHSGVLYILYNECIPAMCNAVQLTGFVYTNPNYTDDKRVIFRDRAPGNGLVRGFSARMNSNVLRATLSRYAKIAMESGRLKTKLSLQRVHLSGIFYRAYQKEECGEPVDFSHEAKMYMELSSDRRDGQPYKLDSGRNTIEAKQRQIERDYLRDYERWKAAWGLI